LHTPGTRTRHCSSLALSLILLRLGALDLSVERPELVGLICDLALSCALQRN